MPSKIVTWRKLGIVAATLATGCTAFTSFDGLTGGIDREPPDALGDASPAHVPDAMLPPAEKVSDSGDGTDAGADADAGPAPLTDFAAWWKLDETAGTTAIDSSWHDNDGALKNGVTWLAGRRGGAASFDGDAAHIFVTPTPSLTAIMEETTVAFWVWLDKRPTAWSERLVNLEPAWEIKINGNNPQFATVPSDRYAIMKNTIAVHEWHHIAFSFDRGEVKGYYDGVPTTFGAYTFTTTSPLPGDSTALTIGTNVEMNAPCMCRLDDVRIYLRVLSDAEIEALSQ